MKLSDVKGDRVMDVIAELVDPIADIAADPVAGGMFTRKAVPDGMDLREFTMNRIREALPVLLKKYKAQIIHILCVIGDLDEAEYLENMTIVSLFRDINDLLTDPDFVQLFH